MFRSIRFRLAAWYTAVITVTFLLFSIIIYEYLHQTLSDSLDASISSEAKWIVSRLEKQIIRGEQEQHVRDDIAEHVFYYPVKEYIEVWDSSGKVFYRSRNLFNDTLSHYLSLSDDRDWNMTTIKRFRTFDVRLAVQKTPLNTVYLGMPTENATLPVNHLLAIFAWVGPIFVVVAIGGGTYLAKKSLSKVNKVIETARSITADRLSDRIPEHNVNDEIGNLIATFNEMISRLDVSFQQMKQFSADASHELKTPLSVMRTQLETALNTRASLSELNTFAANCLDETMRMTAIIENLLLLARADAGKDVVQKVPVELDELLRETYEESVILASQKGIKVTLTENEKVVVRGDEQRLRQMLLNLVDNAIKHNQANGKIELSLTRNKDTAKILVMDNGIGIPEAEIPHIFDRFYRVDRARSRALGGAGLGLSIVHWIVQAHGGSITVRSQLDKGSEFEVVLPLKA